jgi:hypothetical protein
MKRRQFLKSAGAGSLALASIPVLEGLALAGDGQTNFHFVALSQIVGTPDIVAMAGDGQVGPSNAVGGGSFVHFQSVGTPPFPIVGQGTWKAQNLMSFHVAGTYGVLLAGIAEMGIHLVTSGGVVPATLKVVCNLGPAGIFTGQPEGYFLTVGGATFQPFVPAQGLTVYTTANERRGG